MIHHHPPFEMLLDFAAGALTEGAALVIATHVALCPACHAQIAHFEAVGGTLLDEIKPETVGDHVLSTLLDRLDQPANIIISGTRSIGGAMQALIPEPLRRYVGRSLDELPWRRVGRLFHVARLPLAETEVKAYLMRLLPGQLMPKHTHRGLEYSVVLAGGYSDDADQFGRGDFCVKYTTDTHQPKVDADGECLCLVVLHAPVRLTSIIGRLLNPFMGILG